MSDSDKVWACAGCGSPPPFDCGCVTNVAVSSGESRWKSKLAAKETAPERIAALEADAASARKRVRELLDDFNRQVERTDEQRAAYEARIAELEAELVRWDELRKAIATLRGYSDDWPDHGNAPLAIAAGYALTLKRATAAEERAERMAGALRKVLAACDEGRMMPKPGHGAGGMTIEANIRGSVYTGVPAWPIEEARAALTEGETP